MDCATRAPESWACSYQLSTASNATREAAQSVFEFMQGAQRGTFLPLATRAASTLPNGTVCPGASRKDSKFCGNVGQGSARKLAQIGIMHLERLDVT